MNSLGTRLFAAFVSIILVVILIVGFALLVLLRDNPVIERQTYTRLNDVAGAVIRQGPLPANLTRESAAAFVQQLAAVYSVRVLIADPGGRVVVDSNPEAAAINRLNLNQARPDQGAPGALLGRARDANQRLWLYVTRPFGPNRLLVFAEQQPRFPVIAYFAENLLLPLGEAAVVAGLLSAVLAVLISRSIANPLHRMASVAQSIARGDYAQAAPTSGPDEVRALGQSLNSMARQVQAAQQAQRDFVANVSHELKTPLTSIQGFAQAMLDGAAASPDALDKSARIIFDEADRMRRMVEELLDLARLDAGAGAMTRGPVDLRLVLATVVDRFGPRAAERQVNLQADLPGNLPAMVGDADRLAQVFNNLVDNALKHTPAGGSVTLAASPAPGGVAVAVRDTGAGIPPEDVNRIFERFYQVDKSRARSGGAGLGLAITREIVEAHGGRIDVQSVAGLGSNFRVFLPVARGDDTTVARKKSRQ